MGLTSFGGDSLTYQITKCILAKMEWVAQKILYVDPLNGDNTDGCTWATAFTTFAGAYAAAITVANASTEIRLAFGTYDLNIAGAFSLNKNLIINGGFAKVVNFTNTHASATGVFSIDSAVGVYITNCSITCHSGASYQFGIKFNFLGRLDNVRIDMSATTVATSGVLINAGTSGCVFNKVLMGGNGVDSIGFDAQGNGLNECFDLRFFMCAVGLKVSGGNSKYSQYDTLRINWCTLGIQVDVGNDFNAFLNIYFLNLTNNVVNNAISTQLWRLIYPQHEHRNLYPTTCVTGILLQSDLLGVTVAGVYGDWTTIIPAGTLIKPFRITGVFLDTASTNRMYQWQLRVGVGHEILEHIMSGVSNPQMITDMTDSIHNQSSAVDMRLQTNAAINTTADVWIQYELI